VSAFPETLSEVQAFAKETIVSGAPLDELRDWLRRLYDAL